MKIEQIDTDNGILLKLEGSFSGTEKAAIALFERLSKAIQTEPKEIVLDMERTTMMDSMAIGLLVGLLVKSKEKGIVVRTEHINSTIKGIFEMTGLKKAFPQLF